MTRADEMLAALEEAVSALDTAIGDAAGRWQVPLGEGEWPPRTVAEHIVIALGVYTEFMAGALAQPYQDWASRDYAFTSADLAQTALADISNWGRDFLTALQDSVLDTPVPEMSGSTRLPPTIAGVLIMATDHIQEHAAQIASPIRM
jgi:DinB superfamily